ncbi:hypothetical protein HPB49_021054 [Dermacentor silvarum]|uniref:Uncharacterized protein n=1 Tax=Dermacentor silvarum TaxID=543639 RepID=A0ACB8DL36_DERSI|nr:hypothetical protein HPB49_021054 [Dermacentor silvarum]
MRGRGDEHRVVVRSSGYTVTRRDLKTVLGTNWLRDIVIDFCMGLVAERAKQVPDGLRVHVLTTNFFSGLTDRAYDAVSRWTDTVDQLGARAHPRPRPLVNRRSEYNKPCV